jgi:hypothetical protein
MLIELNPIEPVRANHAIGLIRELTEAGAHPSPAVVRADVEAVEGFL